MKLNQFGVDRAEVCLGCLVLARRLKFWDEGGGLLISLYLNWENWRRMSNSSHFFIQLMFVLRGMSTCPFVYGNTN